MTSHKHDFYPYCGSCGLPLIRDGEPPWRGSCGSCGESYYPPLSDYRCACGLTPNAEEPLSRTPCPKCGGATEEGTEPGHRCARCVAQGAE